MLRAIAIVLLVVGAGAVLAGYEPSAESALTFSMFVAGIYVVAITFFRS